MEPKKRKKRFNSKKKNNPLTPKTIKFVSKISTAIYTPKVVEPKPVCKICGKPIETIADSISEPNGGYSHFSCVITKIEKDEKITDKQKVSYLGRGAFGVIETIDGHFSILKTINYETPESFSSMKKFVDAQKK